MFSWGNIYENFEQFLELYEQYQFLTTTLLLESFPKFPIDSLFCDWINVPF